jgi:hypothetical protein
VKARAVQCSADAMVRLTGSPEIDGRRCAAPAAHTSN